jgi:hypothetical protein
VVLAALVGEAPDALGEEGGEAPTFTKFIFSLAYALAGVNRCGGPEGVTALSKVIKNEAPRSGPRRAPGGTVRKLEQLLEDKEVRHTGRCPLF